MLKQEAITVLHQVLLHFHPEMKLKNMHKIIYIQYYIEHNKNGYYASIQYSTAPIFGYMGKFYSKKLVELTVI